MHWILSLYSAALLAQMFAFPCVAQAAGNLTQNSARECAICHFRWIDQFVQGHGTALADYEKEDVAGDELMCFSCHDGSTEDSRSKIWLHDMHKTRIKPTDKVKIPKLFPLSENGEMMCDTCHSAHSNPTDTSIERSVFLRITNNDSIMCEMCHVAQMTRTENHPTHAGKEPLPERIFAEGATRSFTDVKQVICESCHTPHAGVEKNLVYTMADSALCIICHANKIDDTKGPPSEQINHPLHVEFKTDPTREITLQAGEKNSLQCLSCHKVHLHAPATKALVAKKEILCGYCHPDKENKNPSPGTGKANHPLAVAFKAPAEGQFVPPAGDNNSVQCYSCHAIHQHSPGTKGLPAPRDVLCATCHAAQYLVEATDHDFRITVPADINVLEQGSMQFGVCVTCHVPHKATGPYLWSRPTPKAEMTPSGLCLSCHQEKGPAEKKGVGRHSHPVSVELRNIPPLPSALTSLGLGLPPVSGQTPGPFPLPLYAHADGRSLVECHTCHNPHQWQPGQNSKGQGVNAEGDGMNSFLRQPLVGKESLCASCHADQFMVEGTDHDLRVTAQAETNAAGKGVAEAGICSSCHIPHNGQGPMLWAKPLTAERESHSYLCISCHNKKGPGKEKTLGEFSHRLGVTVKEKTELPLVKRDENHLVMDCATCHNPHSWKPDGQTRGSGKNTEGDGDSSFLRKTSLGQAALCMECHALQGNVAGTDHDMRVTAPDSTNMQGKTPAQGSVCSPCHTVHNAASQGGLWNGPLSAPGKDFMARACYGCHSPDGAGKGKLVEVGGHPERFYFGYNKPYTIAQHYMTESYIEYPLFDAEGNKTSAGEITCPTCHEPHIWHPDRIEKGPGTNIEGTPVDSFLRKEVRRGLCYACHGIKTLPLYRYYHVEQERRTMIGPYTPSKRF
jgi:predicted CXXCH cytochrome family protein